MGTIQVRKDTAANWVSANTVLENGEPGLETDTKKSKYGDGTTAWNSLAYFNVAPLSEDTIVNLNSSMSASVIQELIDTQPKNLNGYTLTFQFADGTYTIASTLNFNGFTGGSAVIQGNTSEANATTLHTTQSVHLDGSSLADTVVDVNSCSCPVLIQNLKITVSDGNGRNGVGFHACQRVSVNYSYVVGTGKSLSNQGFYVDSSMVFVQNNYVSNVHQGIYGVLARIYSINNDDTGTAPNYGLAGQNATTIGKYGTQPTGSTQSEAAGSGSVIRS